VEGLILEEWLLGVDITGVKGREGHELWGCLILGDFES